MIDPLILVRSAHIAATALAAGTVLCLVLVAGPAFLPVSDELAVEGATFRRHAHWLIWLALTTAIGSGFGWLVLLAVDIYRAPIFEVFLHGGVWSVLSETRFGIVWVTRLALAVVLGMLILWPAARLLQLAAAAGLIGTLALISHAGATPGAAGRAHLTADVLHLIAAAGWVGALPALALLLDRARLAKSDAWGLVAAKAVRRFSTLGIICVGTLLATGLVNSWNLLAAPRDLIATDYGRLLFLKIGLFATMVGSAALNRFRLTPMLPLPGTMRAIERNTLIEIGLGLCVIAFVGALGTMTPSAHNHVHVTSRPIPSDAAFVHIHSESAMAEVTIEPGRAGPARATILLMREDFSLFAAKEVLFVFTPEAQADAPAISRPATRLPDGTWEVDKLEIEQPGVWIVKLTIKANKLEPFVLDGPIVINR